METSLPFGLGMLFFAKKIRQTASQAVLKPVFLHSHGSFHELSTHMCPTCPHMCVLEISGGQIDNANKLSMDRCQSNNDLNINQCFQKIIDR